MQQSVAIFSETGSGHRAPAPAIAPRGMFTRGSFQKFSLIPGSYPYSAEGPPPPQGALAPPLIPLVPRHKVRSMAPDGVQFVEERTYMSGLTRERVEGLKVPLRIQSGNYRVVE